jgi:hypothetical protein
MATVNEHLSVEELEERYVACGDATASRHFQAIWLLARGHTVSQVSATTAFGERWIEQLLARYNAEGPEALGDLRRRNGASATILRPDLLVAPAPWPAAARWRAVVEPQGRELDGRGTRARVGRAAARLGGLEGDRLVDPGAASEEPEISDAGTSGGV